MSLEIRNMSVPIDDCHIVHDASLTVPAGKLVGLIGANGAGKTTLLRAAAGLLPEATGEALIDDVPAGDLMPRARAKKLAYLPQSAQVDWALTVRDVVALGRFPFQGRFGRLSPSDHEAVNEIMARLGIASLKDRDTRTLSGGERALVLLGRALAVGAPYLLADEPTASLDPARQLSVMELMRAEAGRGTGVLIVLHDLSLAARFLDHVVVMAGGSVIADGPPKDVLDDGTLVRAYGITPITGEVDGERWLLPWRRA